MQDARYFRAQAECCLKLANQVGEAHTAENLRAAAARHFAKAVELETGQSDGLFGKAAAD